MEDEIQQDEEVRIFMIVFNFALQILQHSTLTNTNIEVKIYYVYFIANIFEVN